MTSVPYPTMITVEEAYAAMTQALAAHSRPQLRCRLSTESSLGRVLAEPVTCRFDAPAFDQSAMDGVAFAHRDGQTRLRVVGTVAAGDAPDRIQPGAGECVRIMTGAPVPRGADTVEMIERVRIESDWVTLVEQPSKGAHIRSRGENLRRGQLLFSEQTLITANTLAGLLSQGIRFPILAERPRVGIATTGNEIVDYRRPLLPGQVYNSNALGLDGLMQSPALEVIQLGAFPDDPDLTARCIEANTDFELLILTGGVSMGDFDFVPEAAKRAGFQGVFHKIRMKPGKPLWFGVHREKKSFLFGLPGNPVSAMVSAQLFVRPFARALAMGRFDRPLWANGILEEDTENRSDLPYYAGVSLAPGAAGARVRLVPTSGSGDVARFGISDTLALVPSKTRIVAGDPIQVLLLFHGLIH